ncbi:MAG: DUF4062 domain-containing protein [Chloroflexi bacterium]|nr:DUF4062 domain-containing protein [Chloroflexota bacterium]
MKFFISSAIRGMESYRDAAVRAIRSLGHEPIRAEDFGASPESPQRVCLAGVRAADAVVLLLGARYGPIQKSGLSATHEEYREARDRCPVLVFVQDGVQREPKQEAFVGEVRGWVAGHYTASFSTPDDLRDAVTRALHELALSRAVGPVDEAEILQRARELAVPERRVSQPTISVVVAGGPRQQVLGPSELEDPELAHALMREAIFGAAPVLDPAYGTTPRIDGHALIIEQDHGSVLLDELGTVRIVQLAQEESGRGYTGIPALIEEEVRDRIQQGLHLAGWVLDKVDPVRRLGDVVPVATLLDAGWMPWRTRAEHAASPNSATSGKGRGEILVHLCPARRHRAALTQEAGRLAKDLTVLLRREVRQ